MTYGPGRIVIETGFVRNQDGKAYFFLTNAYDYPINIEIPVIKLMSVERYHEILSVEKQSEDKINAKKDSEKFVRSFDKNKKNPSSLVKVVSNNVEKEKSPGNRKNFVPSFDKNKKNPSSLEKVVSNNVEKKKSPGNRENFVSSFDKKERNPSSQENYVSSFDKEQRNPSSQENYVSSFGKEERNPSSQENIVPSFDKEERNPSSQENYVSSSDKEERNPSKNIVASLHCDVTFNIHVLESAPVLIYRFVVSELPISSLKICTVLKSFHLSFQFTSICLRGSKISRH